MSASISQVKEAASKGCDFCLFLDRIMSSRSSRNCRIKLSLDHTPVVYLGNDQGDTLEVYRVEGTKTNSAVLQNIPTRPHIGRGPLSESSIAFLKGCMDTCVRTHHLCRTGESTPPKRLVDLALYHRGELKIIDISPRSNYRYATLSYCWGDGVSFKATKSNIHDLTAGFSAIHLPKTISDAIEIAYRLGLTYIWIDSLCILQDSLEDWEDQSAKMGQIYKQSHITIASSSAESASESFLETRPWAESESATITHRHGEVIIAARPCCLRGHHNVYRLDDAWLRDPLDFRGWALQEKVLSTRYAAFSPEELQWQCNTVHDCECQVPTTRPMPNLGILTVSNSMFEHWHIVVSEFSRRRLTYPEDKLPALSGVAHYIHRHTGSQYVAGLWADNIIVDLLWEVSPLREDGKVLSYRAPSFSWASVERPVEFPRQGSFPNDESSADTRAGATCNILACETVSTRSDPFGRVQSGSIVIRGPSVQSSIVRRRNFPTAYKVQLGDGHVWFKADHWLAPFSHTDMKDSWRTVDTPLGIVSADPLGEQDLTGMASNHVYLLLVSCDGKGNCYCLVLGAAPSNRDVFERLGIVRITSDNPSINTIKKADSSTFTII
ncbi:putative HET-domain-containing protein [Seiridium cardinale]